MQLVGAAFPRTGTMSTRAALEILGLGKSYHMQEVFLNPEHMAIWEQAADGRMLDWKTFLGDYAATLDGPACFYWREILDYFPDARVLLVRRDPTDWYRSMKDTIFPTLVSGPLAREPAIRMIRHLLLDKVLHSKFEDEAYTVQKYLDYCKEVDSSAPPEKLLVYDVAECWGPLCAFLGLPEPNVPFPAKNTSAEFRKRAGLERGGA